MLPSKRRCIRCGAALPPERGEALDDQGIRRKRTVLGYGYAANGHFCTLQCGFWAAIGALERSNVPNTAAILRAMHRSEDDRVLVYYEDESGCPRAYGTGPDRISAERIAEHQLVRHLRRRRQRDRDEGNYSMGLRYHRVVKTIGPPRPRLGQHQHQTASKKGHRLKAGGS